MPKILTTQPSRKVQTRFHSCSADRRGQGLFSRPRGRPFQGPSVTVTELALKADLSIYPPSLSAQRMQALFLITRTKVEVLIYELLMVRNMVLQYTRKLPPHARRPDTISNGCDALLLLAMLFSPFLGQARNFFLSRSYSGRPIGHRTGN